MNGFDHCLYKVSQVLIHVLLSLLHYKSTHSWHAELRSESFPIESMLLQLYIEDMSASVTPAALKPTHPK